jgi:hypothetical protein
MEHCAVAFDTPIICARRAKTSPYRSCFLCKVRYMAILD